MTRVHQWLATALQGTRQVGFIVGEAGIGKTTLVDAFVAQVESDAALWIGHGQCEELLLDYLSEAAVVAYLARRCPGHDLPAGLARMLQQRTDGNPLFLVTLVDTLSKGTELFRPIFLTLLAEALGTMGHIDEGLRALTTAPAEAETYRLRGELLLRQEGTRHKAKPCRKRKRVFTRPWRLPAASRQNPGSCVPPPA